MNKYDIGDLCYVQMDHKYYLVCGLTSINVQLMDVTTGYIQNVAKGNFLDKVLKKVS